MIIEIKLRHHVEVELHRGNSYRRIYYLFAVENTRSENALFQASSRLLPPPSPLLSGSGNSCANSCVQESSGGCLFTISSHAHADSSVRYMISLVCQSHSMIIRTNVIKNLANT